MEFSRKKLPQNAASTLRSCLIRTVQPYAPMLAPVYVLMRRNEKFVSVKAPLDFFSPEELEKLASFESFFFPEFVDTVIPFQKAARSIRALLSWTPGRSDSQGALPPAPFELEDAVLSLVGPLWSVRDSQRLAIEPFFAAVFANELCEPIASAVLLRAREQDILKYERAIVAAGWSVFLALHLGYCDLDVLNDLRLRVFEDLFAGMMTRSADASGSELDDLGFIADLSIGEKTAGVIDASFFDERSERVARKIASRIRRVTGEFARSGRPIPSIYGEGGFVDV